MPNSKPFAILLFDISFFKFFTISQIIYFLDALQNDPIISLSFFIFNIFLYTLLWYFCSRRGALWSKILLFLFLSLKSFTLIEMIKIYWNDNIRVASSLFLLGLIAISIASILHPTVKNWQDRRKLGDASEFE